MLRSSRVSTLILLTAAVLWAGCDSERKSSSKGDDPAEGGATTGTGSAQTSDPGAGGSDPLAELESMSGQSAGGGGGGVAAITSWDDSNNYPTGLESAPLKGGPMPHSSDAGSSRAPENNWATGDGDGSFILLGSSNPPTNLGDVIRRVEISGDTASEHDFNSALPGTQGLALLVPQAMRGDWDQADFSGDGLFIGKMCGIIPGPKDRAIVFAGKGAFVIDPYANGEGGAIEPEATIVFPRGQQVCDGLYSPQWQALYSFEVARVDGASGKSGLYVAKVPPKGVVSKAGLFLVPTGYGVTPQSRSYFQDGDIHANVLYLSEGGGRVGGSELDVVIHRVPLNDQGEPLFTKATQHRTGNPLGRMQGCSWSNPDNTAAFLAVEAGGTPMLLTGGIEGIAAWDISSETPSKVDMDARAGIQALDLSDDYGRGWPEIQIAPDGTAYAMPYCRSEGKFDASNDGPSPTQRDMFLRQIAEFDLSSDELGQQIQAVDVGYHDFQQTLSQTVNPPRFPNFNMTFRDMAIGNDHILVVGYGGTGNSGLGPGGDVVIVDRNTRKPIVFNPTPDKAKAHEERYGFILAEGDPDVGGRTQSVFGTMWVP